MEIDRLHQDASMYNMYNNYLQTVSNYALNTIRSLPIRYYRANMLMTKETDSDLKLINTNRYKLAYDLFDLTPVIEAQPLTYTNENDETNQGIIRRTMGVITIYGINKPLPGDLFHYYSNGVDNDNSIEVFTVDNVNFIKSSTDLNIYQIEFSTANIGTESLEKLNIINHFYYLKEFKKFFNVDIYEDYQNLLDNRNNYINDINLKYNALNSVYNLSDDIEINRILNNIIYTLNEEFNIGFKFILNAEKTTELFSQYLENNNLTIEDEAIKKLIIIQDIYYKLKNYKMDEIQIIGSNINIANQTVRDLEGNIING